MSRFHLRDGWWFYRHPQTGKIMIQKNESAEPGSRILGKVEMSDVEFASIVGNLFPPIQRVPTPASPDLEYAREAQVRDDDPVPEDPDEEETAPEDQPEPDVEEEAEEGRAP